MAYESSDCPICGVTSVFAMATGSDLIFFYCYGCVTAWKNPPNAEDSKIVEELRVANVAPQGFRMATLHEIQAAGMAQWVFGEVPDESVIAP